MHSTLAAVRALAPRLSARADEVERARRLPTDLVRALAETGAFRMLAPRTAGGLEVDPATALATIETVAEADASCGWCVMIGATAGLNAAYLSPDVAGMLFSDPLAIAGGVFAPLGRAHADGDGYRLSGRWAWASGSAHCQWLGGGAVLVDGDTPRVAGNGAPETRMFVFPRTAATLHDTWHTTGLCGTGSGDIAVDNLYIPARHAVALTGRPFATGPLYAVPVFGLLALGVASVAAGIARGAIADLVSLAAAKTPQGSSRRLAERPLVQAAIAEATAKIDAARAYRDSLIAVAWHAARSDNGVPLDTRARLRLAATHLTRTAADVTRAMYDLAGGSSVFLASPLQRRFRDVHVATQHMMIAPQTYELSGRVLLDVPVDRALL